MNIILLLLSSIIAVSITQTITSNDNFIDTIKKNFLKSVPIKLWHIHSVTILLLFLFLAPKIIESYKDTNTSETESKSITFSEASQMISDDGYRVLDEKIIDGNQFMFLTDDGLYCQIMFINGTLPKEKVKYIILQKGNPIKMKNIWDREF